MRAWLGLTVAALALAVPTVASAAPGNGKGNDVLYVGKPHAPIYGTCLDALQGLEPTEIVAVGDSVEHDVRGAFIS